MKLKKGYIMKELAGRYVVLPVGGKTGIDRSVFGEI